LVASAASAQALDEARQYADHCLFAEALTRLEKAGSSDARSREGLLMRARLLIQLERGREAVTLLEAIGPSKLKSDEADRQLALALAQSAAGTLDAADRHLDQAQRLGADLDLVEGARAVVLLQRGKLDQAERVLRAVLSRSPLLTGALLNLAVVHARRGQRAEAAALIRQAWHAGERDAATLAKDPDLGSIMKTPGLVDDLPQQPTARCAGW
jgi:tetratricopeptide (TPR) repeat protein